MGALMSTKNITRVSLDIPSDYHKQLKVLATLQGKSLRQLILESVDAFIAKRSEGEIPEHERWIHNPANKKIVEHIQKGLRQKATIYRGSFAKRVK